VHRHKVKSTQIVGWTQCITPDECAAHPEKQDAHGGVLKIDTCSCGAIRRSEVNGTASNRTSWEVRQ
jgi:hypothetical protein